VRGIIPNRTVHTRLSGRMEEFLRQNYRSVLLPSIRENARLAEAGGFHAPIQVSAPASTGALDFVELTRVFLEREERFFTPALPKPAGEAADVSTDPTVSSESTSDAPYRSPSPQGRIVF